jgi:hypothetical protein
MRVSTNSCAEPNSPFMSWESWEVPRSLPSSVLHLAGYALLAETNVVHPTCIAML